jgi:hypothetical protein
MDPMKEVARLLNRATARTGVRPLAKLTKIPATTLSHRRRHPGTWKIAEIRRVFDACALNDRLSVQLHGSVPATLRKGRQPKRRHVAERHPPKNQPTTSRVARVPHRHPRKSSRSPK